jgi:plastocyanin
MKRIHDNRTDESSDETVTNWPDLERRPLLKALGVGAGISIGTGTAAASGDGPGVTASESSSGETDAERIDPLYGRSIPDAEELPARLQPDHEVELHVAPPGQSQPPLFHFDPTGLSVNAGDVVQFTFTSPDHTVTAYHPGHGFQRRVPETAPPFSSPIVNAGGAWLYRFEQQGLYDLYCGPHHILGMVMRVVVGDMSEENVPAYEDTFEGREGGEEQPPLMAPFSKQFLEHELNEFSEQNENCEWVWLTPRQVLDADVLDPMAIQDAGDVPFDAVAEELGYQLE